MSRNEYVFDYTKEAGGKIRMRVSFAFGGRPLNERVYDRDTAIAIARADCLARGLLGDVPEHMVASMVRKIVSKHMTPGAALLATRKERFLK